MLTGTERLELLLLARNAIESAVRGHPPPPIPATEICRRELGAFVTLTLDARLRGCIGYPHADQPLGAVVVRCAEGACVRDTRFRPVQAHELQHLHIELSVLGPLETLANPLDIEIGRHGLFVEHEGRRGLLLPQVAVEWGWDCETFLGQACVKAGLPTTAWRDGAEVFRFEAEVFGETASPPEIAS